MNRIAALLTLIGWTALLPGGLPAAEPGQIAKTRVLLTTGGHAFEVAQFYAMFDAMLDVQYTKAELPKDADLLKPGLEKQYDVLVRYDMVAKISPQQQEAFVALLKTGVGLVSLHHNLGAHRDWPEYPRIIGGQFFLKDTELGGKTYPKSTWAHGQDLNVTVVDREHRITRGLKDFTIHDETYGGYYVAPEVHVLLTTDNPKNTPQIAWTTHYGRSPVAYIMLGHDHTAYENPSYAEIVGRAIHWAAEERKRK